jgi:hypothetical protein
MRHLFPACLLSIAVSANCFAQPMPQTGVVVGASESAVMAQRVLQYELMLGYELNPTLAICVDEVFMNSWMLPGNAETQPSDKGVERVRRRLEICQAEVPANDRDFRFAAEIRMNLEARLKAARALELSKTPAKDCLEKSKTQEAFQACLTDAFNVAPSESLWLKWLALFERRPTVAALR